MEAGLSGLNGLSMEPVEQGKENAKIQDNVGEAHHVGELIQKGVDAMRPLMVIGVSGAAGHPVLHHVAREHRLKRENVTIHLPTVMEKTVKDLLSEIGIV